MDENDDSFVTLREFFVELLLEDNLARYHNNRDSYLKERTACGRGLSPKDAELVRNGSLREIEERILAEYNSPGPRPWLMVMPP